MSISFLITTLVVVATPGTGVVYTLSAGLSRGRRAAVIAAVGGFQSWATCDHAHVARHARYPREGYLYV